VGVKILDVFEAIKERRSIRNFRDETILKHDIDHLIEASLWAPSAGNIHPLGLVIVRDANTKCKLSEAALNQTFIQKAPVCFVFCADVNRSRRGYGRRGEELYSLQDTAAAVQNLLLAAQALGLGTCWVGAFDEMKVAKVVNAPYNMKPVAIVPLGYPAEYPVAPFRRSVSEIVHYETF
jgi:nitroreductase